MDTPEDSRTWAEAKGFRFALASDPEQVIIGRFGLVNPSRPELSLHAIYVIDSDGRVLYRKIARRRAYADEIIDAIDYHLEKYVPRHKPSATR